MLVSARAVALNDGQFQAPIESVLRRSFRVSPLIKRKTGLLDDPRGRALFQLFQIIGEKRAFDLG